MQSNCNKNVIINTVLVQLSFAFDSTLSRINCRKKLPDRVAAPRGGMRELVPPSLLLRVMFVNRANPLVFLGSRVGADVDPFWPLSFPVFKTRQKP